MKSYSTLRVIARWFKICAYSNLILGIGVPLVFALVASSSDTYYLNNSPVGLLIAILCYLLALATIFVFFMAVSEFIMVWVNVAVDVADIKDSLSEIKSSTPNNIIDPNEL